MSISIFPYRSISKKSGMTKNSIFEYCSKINLINILLFFL